MAAVFHNLNLASNNMTPGIFFPGVYVIDQGKMATGA